MKYFTQELLEKNQSLDDGVSDAAHEEWERNIEAYRASLASLPPDVRQLAEGFAFHDGEVKTVSRLRVLERPDLPGVINVRVALDGRVYKITYSGAAADDSAEESLVGADWLYDEVSALRCAPSADRRSEADWYFHNILTTRGEAAIRFKAATVSRST